jgi:hypothetical protein
MSAYYHATIRKTIIAFGNLFNEIDIYSEHLKKDIRVPLTYTAKEKFDKYARSYNMENESTKVGETLPKMGFELVGLMFDTERSTSANNLLTNNCTGSISGNRVPYRVSFNLYIATRSMQDSFRITEQIYPYFTPSIDVTMIDNTLGLESVIPFTLGDPSFILNADGDMSEFRSIVWTLPFTADVWMYPAVDDSGTGVIKNITIEFGDDEELGAIERSVCYIDPTTANKNDNYIVKSYTKTINDNNTFTDAVVDGGGEFKVI